MEEERTEIPFRRVSETPDPVKQRSRKNWHWKTGILFFIVLSLCLIARVAEVGLPSMLTEHIARGLSSPVLYVELENANFSLFRLRLNVGKVRVFRRGIFEKPVCELKGASVFFRPSLSAPSLRWIRSVEANSCEISSAQEMSLLSGNEEPAGPDGDGPENILQKAFPQISVFCREIDVFGFSAHGVRGTLSCTQGVLVLENFSARIPERQKEIQRISGNISFHPAVGDIHADFAGNLNPVLACPLLEELGLSEVSYQIARFSFPSKPPHVTVLLRYLPDRAERSLTFDVRGEDCLYRNVPVSSFSGTLSVTGDTDWEKLTISPLHVERPEGEADGWLKIYLNDSCLRFSATSRIDPLPLFKMVPVLAEDMDLQALPVSFDNPTLVKAEGIYSYSDAAVDRTQISGTLLSPGLTLFGQRLGETSADVQIRQENLILKSLKTSVFGGDCTLTGSSNLLGEKETMKFALDGLLTNLVWRELSPLLLGERPDDRAPGHLNGNFTLEAPFSAFREKKYDRICGRYHFRLQDTVLFRIPLFVGLTDILADTVPGINFLTDQNHFLLDGKIQNGRLDVDGFQIFGTAFSLSGTASYWFADQTIEALAKLHLLNRSTWIGRGIYYLTSPLSLLLSIRADGTLANPRWDSVILSPFYKSRRESEDRANGAVEKKH